MLQDQTLNESGAALVLIYTAALISLPRKNIALLYAAFPAFAFLLIITTSRTAVIVFVLVTVAQLILINPHQRSKRYGDNFLIAFGFIFFILFAVFFRPIYRFFTLVSISTDGVDLNQLTSKRYDLRVTVLNHTTLLGEGRDYIDFTGLLHLHNILLDTLGRYGMVTALLFTALLAMAFVLSMMSVKIFNIALYIFAFILIGMFEYNYLFIFVYFSSVVVLFVVRSYWLGVIDRGGKRLSLSER